MTSLMDGLVMAKIKDFRRRWGGVRSALSQLRALNNVLQQNTVCFRILESHDSLNDPLRSLQEFCFVWAKVNRFRSFGCTKGSYGSLRVAALGCSFTSSVGSVRNFQGAQIAMSATCGFLCKLNSVVDRLSIRRMFGKVLDETGNSGQHSHDCPRWHFAK